MSCRVVVVVSCVVVLTSVHCCWINDTSLCAGARINGVRSKNPPRTRPMPLQPSSMIFVLAQFIARCCFTAGVPGLVLVHTRHLSAPRHPPSRRQTGPLVQGYAHVQLDLEHFLTLTTTTTKTKEGGEKIIHRNTCLGLSAAADLPHSCWGVQVCLTLNKPVGGSAILAQKAN
jgi:hypothetical protein